MLPASLTPEFGHWLAGFTDGEGCFMVKPNNGSVLCRFRIALRTDDEPILREIQAALGGIGGMHRDGYGRHHPLIVETFDAYPLRAKKARDFDV